MTRRGPRRRTGRRAYASYGDLGPERLVHREREERFAIGPPRASGDRAKLTQSVPPVNSPISKPARRLTQWMKDPDNPRLRVVVADDDPLASRVLREVLQDGGFVVVAEAHTASEALELTLHYRPDVLLLDMIFPDGDAIDVVKRLSAAGAGDVVTIVVTSHHDDETGMRVLRAGARGWLSKDLDLGDLPRAVRAAVAGEVAVSRRFSRTVVDELRATPDAQLGVRPVLSPLTKRQWEVLDLICAGQSNAEIAGTLGLSSDTVRAHVRAIERTAGVRGREALIAAAVRLRTAN